MNCQQQVRHLLLLVFVSRGAGLSMLRVSPTQQILSSTSHNYHFFTGNVIKAK